MSDRWLDDCSLSGPVGGRARDAANTPKRCLIDVADQLRSFDKPALVIWPTDDRMMPRSHSAHLADLLP